MTAASARKPNIFTVPPGRPFLAALAEAILAGDLPRQGGVRPSPLDLPGFTILTPTRRAARALQDAFLDAAGGVAMLLPTIRPIAEGQEDLGLIESAAVMHGLAEQELTIPPAIGALERTLLLTKLVMAWSQALKSPRPGTDPDAALMAPAKSAAASTPAQAARLAVELARLIDAIETEGVSLDKLKSLVPEAYSAHWQQTLDFLRIVTEFWPAHLAEQKLISSADRRNRLIRAEAERLVKTPPKLPIIVAGVTGSVPATAELMRAVAALANGAIVLPGLDQNLDADGFACLTAETEPHPEHPQFGLAQLLHRLGVVRGDVMALPGAPLDANAHARNRVVSEAMRPSGTMSGWLKLKAETQRRSLAPGLDGISLIETPTAEDEAEAVALILREALETPGRTAALVSPDRLLARRVAARLEAWGIRVDDSAGRPFAKTVPGSFLDLVAGALQSNFAPAETMALLKHPLTRLGLGAGDIRRTARNLEVAALRATYLGRGLASLAEAVERARIEVANRARRHRSVMAINEAGWTAMADLVERLAKAFTPVMALAKGAAHSLGEIVAAHVAVAEAIAEPAAGTIGLGGATDGSPLWAREEGAAASLLLARLMSPDAPQPEVRLAEYPELYRSLVGSESIRTRVPRHPRLFIWGPYEARLQQPDLVVLGSLNEGVWPKTVDPGPWLNRGMRAELGLPNPEEETGRAAHDLTVLLGAKTVYLTRADKVAGVPMVASRWLLRLKALLEGLGFAETLKPAAPWVAWARARDLAPEAAGIKPPEPRPPAILRPRQASVSDVETWIANPYALYAKKILKLDALPELGQPPGPSERGQIVHETLARFTKAHPERLPDDVVGAFMTFADEVIGTLGREPRIAAFWRPRLARFAHWFAETEAARREPGSRRLVEIAGKHIIAAPGGPFTLTARADRIDVDPDGLVITDYKTGSLPNDKKVLAGVAAQLPLEAAMARAGVFPEIQAQTVKALRYIRATGGEPAGEERAVNPKDSTIDAIGQHALDQLAALVAEFDDEATPYSALRRRLFDYSFDDYAHLARHGEWAAGIDSGADE